MRQAFPEILARGAARQLYRILRISAPLLRPLYRHIGLESRARAVTALVRIGWNGAEMMPPPLKQSEIVAPESLAPGIACIGHPAAESGVGEALRGTARALQTAHVPFTLFGLEQYTTARLQDRSMAAHESRRLGSRANLICDGLIGADVAVRALGPEAFAGRTSILRPFWELSKVPARFAESLSRFQEIWAPSEFVREAFAARRPVIASDFGAMSESVSHGVDGLLVAPGAPAELAAALRRCVMRGQPFGDEGWVKRTAPRLGLASTLRPRGRPRKASEKGSRHLFLPLRPACGRAAGRASWKSRMSRMA